jgi:SET domain-containing protein
MKNYLKESWLDSRIEIRSSSFHGKGMFALEDIKKGEIVVIWGGVFVTSKEAEIAVTEGKIVMQLDDDLFSIEEKGEDPTYFINHSCNPNVWMKDEVTLIARTEIKPDDELTTDYALFEAWEDFVSPWECVCGSEFCRKKITGKDWRIQELQERYKGHFLPLITKRIEKLRNS